MAKTKLPIPDQRILQLMEWAVSSDLVKNEGQFWDKIGFIKNNVSNVRRGHQSFRIDHITAACTLTGANANWVLGIEEEMFRNGTAKDPVQIIKQALRMLEIKKPKRGAVKRSTNKLPKT